MSYQKTASDSPDKTSPPGWYADQGTGFVRWWNGHAWGVYQQTQVAPARNGLATAALILGIGGLVLIPIPLFIGWVVGGIPAALAVLFGIRGIVRANRLGGNGFSPSLVGLVLGGVALLSTLVGAGSLW